MNEFAFRENSGQIHPEQIAYVDGYAIGERLLEGVRFKVEIETIGVGSRLVCKGVHPDDAMYMDKFTAAKIAGWCRQAERHLFDEDGDGTAPDGTTLHWGDT